MAAKKEMAPIGLDPIDAGTALGIESKAVFKYSYYLGNLFSQNVEILIFAGVEAVTG